MAYLTTACTFLISEINICEKTPAVIGCILYCRIVALARFYRTDVSLSLFAIALVILERLVNPGVIHERIGHVLTLWLGRRIGGRLRGRSCRR